MECPWCYKEIYNPLRDDFYCPKCGEIIDMPYYEEDNEEIESTEVEEQMKAICSWANFCENHECPHIKLHEPIDVYFGKLCNESNIECESQLYREMNCENVEE